MPVKGNVILKVPDQSRVGRQRLVIMGKEPAVTLRSNVEKVCVEVQPPTIQNPVADDERFYNALMVKDHEALKLDYEVTKTLPKILRDSGLKVTASY